MSQKKIVLSAVAASAEGCDWVRRIVHSSLHKTYDFEVICTQSIRDHFSDLGVPVHGVADTGEIGGLLRQIRPDMIQTFSTEDHGRAARYVFFNRTILLATHLSAERAIRASLINRMVYNRLTDVNLFIDRDAKVNSGANGYMGLKRPMILTQDHLGEDSVITMLEHAYSSLLLPARLDISGNIKKDFADLRLSYITHFYCNQQDISAITRLLERYASYPPEILAQIQFVIVDDGSPIEYQVPDLPLNLTWLKIDQDIRWNQPGARNLGAVYSRAETLLLADMDHEVPLEAMQRLLKRSSCGKRLYKMWREDENGKIYKGHSNLFVMSRGRFFECYGYDEEFSGHYASDDYRFVKYQKARGSFQTYLPKSIRCIERRDIDRKRSYHSLVRDLSFNTPVDSRKRRELDEYGRGYGHSRMFLNFTWTMLADRQLKVELPREHCHSWKHGALLRQILPRW